MLFSERRYDAGTLSLMTQVLDDAWLAVVSKSVYRALDPTGARHAMAKAIMEAVDGGQWDADHLKCIAMLAVERPST